MRFILLQIYQCFSVNNSEFKEYIHIYTTIKQDIGWDLRYHNWLNEKQKHHSSNWNQKYSYPMVKHMEIQSTPLNRVNLVPGCFDSIKRRTQLTENSVQTVISKGMSLFQYLHIPVMSSLLNSTVIYLDRFLVDLAEIFYNTTEFLSSNRCISPKYSNCFWLITPVDQIERTLTRSPENWPN